MAFTIEREVFPAQKHKPSPNEIRTAVGTAPAFYCNFSFTERASVNYATGYKYRRKTLDLPGVYKAKPYFAITYNRVGCTTWTHRSFGGARECSSILGQSEAQYLSLFAIPGSVVTSANSPTTANFLVPSDLQSAAMIHAYNKLRDVKLDIAEFLGEFLETRNMIMSSFAKGGRMLLAISRKDFRGFAKEAVGAHRSLRWIRSPEYKALKGRFGKKNWDVFMRRLDRARFKGSKVVGDNPADHYFFWNFGILPLLSVLFDARDEKLGMSRVLTFKESAYRTMTRPIDSTNVSGFRFVGKDIVRVRVLLKAAARPEDLALFNTAFLGINSPIDVVRGLWAATPFSWLVDYFLKIGDWLNALSAPVGLSFMDGCISTRVSTEVVVSREPFKDSSYELIPKGSSKIYINAFKRDVLSSFPFIGAPPVGSYLKPNQQLNIGMLLLQRLRK